MVLSGAPIPKNVNSSGPVVAPTSLFTAQLQEGVLIISTNVVRNQMRNIVLILKNVRRLTIAVNILKINMKFGVILLILVKMNVIAVRMGTRLVSV